jgi:agmatinase
MGSPAAPGFLGLPPEAQDPARARVVVLPIPYEATVSYEGGTRAGPDALIAASSQVELYDEELDCEPALKWGVHTLAPLPCGFASGDEMVETVAKAAQSALLGLGIRGQGSARADPAGALPSPLLLSLGGEHSITPGLVRGVRRALGRQLTVVQIDAHADLRGSYEADPNSHACAMRRVLDENPGPTVQLGIRSFSQEEADFIRSRQGRVNVFTMARIAGMGWRAVIRALRRFVSGRDVYLTIDVDGLDPSVIPATGTPEPGGLSWEQALDIVRTVGESSRVAAMDCVELAPRPGMHMADFAAAKLLYRALSFAIPG